MASGSNEVNAWLKKGEESSLKGASETSWLTGQVGGNLGSVDSWCPSSSSAKRSLLQSAPVACRVFPCLESHAHRIDGVPDSNSLVERTRRLS